MRTRLFYCCALGISLALAGSSSAQVVLSGTNYLQSFNSLASGLPLGWSVTTAASATSLGTAANFQSAHVDWSASLSGEPAHFRNVSSNTIAVGASGSLQASNPDRALGWRPSSAASRDGAITLVLQNTTGWENFQLSVQFFTGNSVSLDQSYALEYRVGSTGSFTAIGSTYQTSTPFHASTFTVTAAELAALNDQPELVYLRIRGVTPSGTGSGLDTVAIDNFSLSYAAAAAIPEPLATGWLAGAALLVALIHRRNRARNAPADENQEPGLNCSDGVALGAGGVAPAVSSCVRSMKPR